MGMLDDALSIVQCMIYETHDYTVFYVYRFLVFHNKIEHSSILDPA